MAPAVIKVVAFNIESTQREALIEALNQAPGVTMFYWRTDASTGLFDLGVSVDEYGAAWGAIAPILTQYILGS